MPGEPSILRAAVAMSAMPSGRSTSPGVVPAMSGGGIAMSGPGAPMSPGVGAPFDDASRESTTVTVQSLDDDGVVVFACAQRSCDSGMPLTPLATHAE